MGIFDGVGEAVSSFLWGDSGESVGVIQDTLNKIGFTNSVDGTFGYETDKAVKDFQEANGLESTGVVDETTWNAMETAASEKIIIPEGSFAFPDGNYETTLDYIESNLINNIEIGGQIVVIDTDIYYIANGHEGYASQEIVFGSNLLDLTEFIDASEIYTVLIPVGKDNLTLANDFGVDYIEDQTAIEMFGRIVRKEDFSDAETSTDLYTLGAQTLAENIEEHTTIDISAFDLSLLHADADSFKVGEYVRVISGPHNLDKYYICSGITLDLCDPSKSTFTLGVNPDTLTSKQAGLVKRVTNGDRQPISDKPITITYSVVDGNAQITSISLYKLGKTVYLTYTVQFLKTVPNSAPSIISFNPSYAPAAVQVGTAYDETTGKSYTMQITTDGYVQVINNEEIAINDVVSGSINWELANVAPETGYFYGIDVSSWNDYPDWTKAKGISLAIIRITNRSGTVDTSFEHNYAGATAAGLDVGVYKYSYATSGSESRAEAQRVIEVLNGRTLTHPVWLDLEWETQETYSESTITSIIEEFNDVITAAGYEVGIYCNRNWWQHLIPAYAKEKYDFWIAAPPANDYGQLDESLRPSYGVGWQYSWKGTVAAGFSTDTLDMNVFYRRYNASP